MKSPTHTGEQQDVCQVDLFDALLVGLFARRSVISTDWSALLDYAQMSYLLYQRLEAVESFRLGFGIIWQAEPLGLRDRLMDRIAGLVTMGFLRHPHTRWLELGRGDDYAWLSSALYRFNDGVALSTWLEWIDEAGREVLGASQWDNGFVMRRLA